MNEEQKEENIPAPVPSENNNQNIAPVKRWQIKSWHIVLVGGCLNFLSIFYLWFQTFKEVRPGTEGDIMSFIFGLFELIIMSFLLLPAFLLLSEGNKVKKIGAILSLVFGLISVYILSDLIGLIKTNDSPFASNSSNTIASILFVFIIYSISFLVAGIYYFWKKV